MQMQLKIKRMKLDVLFVNEDQISVLKVNNHFYTKLQIRYQLDVSDRCIRFVIQGVLALHEFRVQGSSRKMNFRVRWIFA